MHGGGISRRITGETVNRYFPVTKYQGEARSGLSSLVLVKIVLNLDRQMRGNLSQPSKTLASLPKGAKPPLNLFPSFFRRET